MSRFDPEKDLTPIFDAAEAWKTAALEGQGAVLGAGAIWTDDNLAGMQKYFVENLDYGDGNFISKLERQLETTGDGVRLLAAEMLWFMLLCPSNVGPDSKRETILTIWGWTDSPLPTDSKWLSDDVLTGIASAGVGYNTNRWRELIFLVEFLRAFRGLPDQKQQALLRDAWSFAEWFEQVPDADKRQLRHMILYLLFPDSFEAVFGTQERRKIVQGFTGISRREVRMMSPIEISREIQRIRAEQEEKLGEKELSFYTPPLDAMWMPDEKPLPTVGGDKALSEFVRRTQSVTADHVHRALDQIDIEGYPENLESTLYDLIRGSNRYPPKYVVSLAVEIATGSPFPTSFFHGGKESQSFKFLEKLGFHIERKDFISDLIRKFVSQADEGLEHSVSEYPKEYRGLKVNVSFGKGDFARVPWISFTGYEQTTSDGIYPVVLYYKSLGVLIVSRGISETHTPKMTWPASANHQTIGAYMQGTHGTKPDRYRSSYVHQVFDLAEQPDDSEICSALDEVIGAFHDLFAAKPPPPGSPPYPREEALRDLFITEEKFDGLLALLEMKKNLILQGPPGVGKTFVCKRLAYTLIGEKNPEKLGMVQFHQSYSYEDFIQGYRPSGHGFRLKNGVFYEFCDRARNDPAGNYVFIIDELNRGNLSKVFGELMLLIEPDKRGPDWAIPLTYAEDGDETFYVPENLYLIGLMNTADRSLAMVDYALRRRFAFADLEPAFELDEFQDFLKEHGADEEFIAELVGRMAALNAKIAEDTTNLGRGFCVGHSFFCALTEGMDLDWSWYERIVKTEIAPLLREYYFDDSKQANAHIDALLRKG